LGRSSSISTRVPGLWLELAIDNGHHGVLEDAERSDSAMSIAALARKWMDFAVDSTIEGVCMTLLFRGWQLFSSHVCAIPSVAQYPTTAVE